MGTRETYDGDGNLVLTEDIPVDNMKVWLIKMLNSDVKLPRSLEDLIDVLSDEQKLVLAPQTLDLYNAKKSLRAQKP